LDLGCEAKYAKDFVYTENININDKSTEIPIGVSCRTCDRLDCSQRAFLLYIKSLMLILIQEVFQFMLVIKIKN
jgi:predicted transcriptional regulator